MTAKDCSPPMSTDIVRISEKCERYQEQQLLQERFFGGGSQPQATVEEGVMHPSSWQYRQNDKVKEVLKTKRKAGPKASGDLVSTAANGRTIKTSKMDDILRASIRNTIEGWTEKLIREYGPVLSLWPECRSIKT
jgi:hypothetical protein